MVSFFFYNTDKESVTSAGGGIMKKYILAAVLLLGMAGAAGVSYGSGSTEDLMAPIAYTDWEIGKSKRTTGNLVAVRDMNTAVPAAVPPACPSQKKVCSGK